MRELVRRQGRMVHAAMRELHDAHLEGQTSAKIAAALETTEENVRMRLSGCVPLHLIAIHAFSLTGLALQINATEDGKLEHRTVKHLRYSNYTKLC